VKDRTLKGLITNWQGFIASQDDEKTSKLRLATRTGRPAGDDDFVKNIEQVTGRELRIGMPGRPRKQF
jgi:hypothetical protein